MGESESGGEVVSAARLIVQNETDIVRLKSILTKELLKQGIWPLRVKRIVEEFEDHYREKREEEGKFEVDLEKVVQDYIENDSVLINKNKKSLVLLLGILPGFLLSAFLLFWSEFLFYRLPDFWLNLVLVGGVGVIEFYFFILNTRPWQTGILWSTFSFVLGLCFVLTVCPLWRIVLFETHWLPLLGISLIWSAEGCLIGVVSSLYLKRRYRFVVVENR